MSSTTILPPDNKAGGETISPASPSTAPPDRQPAGRSLPDPVVEKMRGPKLIVLWLALIAGAWAVAGAAIYGLYTLVGPFLL